MIAIPILQALSYLPIIDPSMQVRYTYIIHVPYHMLILVLVIRITGLETDMVQIDIDTAVRRQFPNARLF